MRSIVIAVAAFVAAVAFATAAHADWRYTNWQMSRAHVIAASNGAVHPASGGADLRVYGFDLGAQGTYEEEGRSFVAEFYFDGAAGPLRVVRLNSSDAGVCDAQRDALHRRYGAPEQSETIPFMPELRTMIWHDRQSGDRVQMMHATTPVTGWDFRCHVTYQRAGS